MKKTLLFTAVLASLASSAFAQDNVTIYGVVDLGYNHTSNGVSSINAINSGIQSGSRLGFKGTEDLGGGSKAIFDLETGINVDTGGFAQNNTAFGRQAWGGLSNQQLGTVKLGLQYAPLRVAVENVDPFAVGFSGNALKTLGSGGYVERVSNAADYATPTFHGFSAQAMYGFGEVAGNTAANRTVGAGLNYDNGPLTVRYAYNNRNSNPTGVDQKFQDNFLGAVYDFGFVKAHAAVAQRTVDDRIADTSARVRDYLVGVTVPYGPHTFLASYIHNDVRTTDDADSNQYSLGYTYNLSKRTDVYTSWARYTNQSNAALNVAGNGLNGSQYNVGMRHLF